jgi:hypothetical protein
MSLVYCTWNREGEISTLIDGLFGSICQGLVIYLVSLVKFNKFSLVLSMAFLIASARLTDLVWFGLVWFRLV